MIKKIILGIVLVIVIAGILMSVFGGDGLRKWLVTDKTTSIKTMMV